MTSFTSILSLAVYFIAFIGIDCACDREWQYHNGNCYWSSLYQHTNENHKVNWFNAQIECRKRGSDLASIHNAGENHFIFKMTRCSNTWNGLVMTNPTAGASHNSWNWVNTEYRDYINWVPGHPSISHGWDAFSCSYVSPSHSEKWMQGRCGHEKLHYVCRKPALSTSDNSTIPNFIKVQGVCKKGWYMLGTRCYHVNNTKVDFFAALLHCQSLKSKLVTIHSSSDNADLTTVFDQCETPWVGLENTDPNNVHQNIGWKWNDNTDVDYSNWVNSAPVNDRARQCATLETGSAWINRNCWELHPFVCEDPIPEN